MDLVTYALSKKYTDDSIKGSGAIKGENGDSAYQVAVKNGFVGTEQEWLASLEGDPGQNGTNGISPSVTVEPTPNGNQVNITDAEGTKSFEVKDGTGGTSSYITEVKLMKNKWVDNTQKTTSEIFKAGDQYVYTVSPSESTEQDYLNNEVEAISVDDTGMIFKCSTVPSIDVLAKINRTESQVIEPTYPKNVAVIRNENFNFNVLGTRSNGPIDVGAKVQKGKEYNISFHWKITISDSDRSEQGYGNLYIQSREIFPQGALVQYTYKGTELIGKTIEGDYTGVLKCSNTDLEGTLPMLRWDFQYIAGEGTITNLNVIEVIK